LLNGFARTEFNRGQFQLKLLWKALQSEPDGPRPVVKCGR
jgi:hypothetical protein